MKLYRKVVLAVIVIIFIIIAIKYSFHFITIKNHEKLIQKYQKENNFDMVIYHITKLLEIDYNSELIYERAICKFLKDPTNLQQASSIFTTAYQSMHYPYDEFYFKCIRGKIASEIKAKTYNFFDETELLNEIVDDFYVNYFKGIYYYLNDQYESAQSCFENAYDVLKTTNSDSLNIKYEDLRIAFFVRYFSSSIPSLNSAEIGNKQKNEFLYHEINTFLAMCYLINQDYESSIDMLEYSSEFVSNYPHELFLLFYLYDVVDDKEQSKSKLLKLKKDYPNFINYQLMDKKNELIEILGKDKKLNILIKQIQSEKVKL